MQTANPRSLNLWFRLNWRWISLWLAVVGLWLASQAKPASWLHAHLNFVMFPFLIATGIVTASTKSKTAEHLTLAVVVTGIASFVGAAAGLVAAYIMKSTGVLASFTKLPDDTTAIHAVTTLGALIWGCAALLAVVCHAFMGRK